LRPAPPDGRESLAIRQNRAALEALCAPGLASLSDSSKTGVLQARKRKQYSDGSASARSSGIMHLASSARGTSVNSSPYRLFLASGPSVTGFPGKGLLGGWQACAQRWAGETCQP